MLKVAQGDKKAFEELFHIYHNKLGSYVMRWTKCLSTTEEIVQDVFLKIWQNREVLSTVENFDKYLYVVSRNHTFNALRNLARERRKNKEFITFTEVSQGIDDEYNAELYLPLIEEAVAKLPSQQQKVFNLKRERGLKYAEIAKLMNISPETARKHNSVAVRSIMVYVKTHIHILLFLIITITC